MPTTRKAITFSMPPELADQVQQILKEEGRTMRRGSYGKLSAYTWTSGSGYVTSAANGPRPAGTTRSESGGRTDE